MKFAEFASIEALCKIEFGNESANPLYYAHHLYIDGEEVTEVDVPDGIETLKCTFAGGSYLTSVTIPNSVTSIGDRAFLGCRYLTSVEIPYSVTSIGDKAFFGCSGLTSIEIPNSVTSIGDNAFFSCSGLTSIEIPNSVTTIGTYAFQNCSLKSFYLLEGENDIVLGSEIFLWCPVKELSIGRPFNEGYFRGSSITSLSIGGALTEIGASEFKGCDELETLNLGSSLTTIGDEAFSGCKALTKVIVPPSVETIGEKAFANIPDLATIVMGHSVANIGAEAFDGASARDIYITAQVPPTAPNNTFSSYTGKLWLQDSGDNKVLDAYYDAFTCWDRFDSQAMVVATSIDVDRKNVNAAPGAAVQLTATVMPDNASLPYVFWRSTNPDVATVDPNGVVTIVDADEDGAATCTIIAETLYADGPVCEVTVNVDTTGIDDVIADSADNSGDIDYSAPYEIYNLNGVKVAADSLEGLSHGFYIVRQGSVAKKIALN